MSVSTKPAKLDSVCEAAVDLAREALLEMSGAETIGAHLGVVVEGERLVTHIFECLLPGYVGWTWSTTVTRLPRTKKVTVCETALLPTESSILAPEWVPFTERLQPGDLGRNDTLPYVADDIRLENGFELVDDTDADALQLFELGLGRSRVMSHVGRTDASLRWEEGDFGPVGAEVDSTCGSCGFMLLMGGSFRNTFGVCGNEWSPADGRVVSLKFACGAHSETDLTKRTQPSRGLPVDDLKLDVAAHEGDAETDDAAASEDAGEADGDVTEVAAAEVAEAVEVAEAEPEVEVVAPVEVAEAETPDAAADPAAPADTDTDTE